jgi:hypothetical protein
MYKSLLMFLLYSLALSHVSDQDQKSKKGKMVTPAHAEKLAVVQPDGKTETSQKRAGTCQSMSQIDLPGLVSADVPGAQSTFQSVAFLVRDKIYPPHPSTSQWVQCNRSGYGCPKPENHLIVGVMLSDPDPGDGIPHYIIGTQVTSSRPNTWTVGRLVVTYTPDPAKPFECASQISFRVARGTVNLAYIRIPPATQLIGFDLSARPLLDAKEYPWKLCNHNVSEGCAAPGAYTGVGMSLSYHYDDQLDYAHGFIARCGNNNSFEMGCRATLYYR